MSSISSMGSTATAIEFLGKDKYKVFNPLDADGDGVVDGKSLSGAQGKIVNEGAVNQMLAAHGLKVSNGQFQSVDGFGVNSTNAPAVTAYGGAPVLPDVSGAMATNRGVGDTLNWMRSSDGITDGALMWMTLSTLARTAMRDVKDAKDLKHALQLGKLDAQRAEIAAAMSKIEAQRAEADRAFTWSVAGAVVQGVASFGGSKLSGSAGLLAEGLSSRIGDIVTKFGESRSYNSGPKAKEAYAMIQEKTERMNQEIAQMAIDEADANYQEAKELMKLALKILTDVSERRSQEIQAATRA